MRQTMLIVIALIAASCSSTTEPVDTAAVTTVPSSSTAVQTTAGPDGATSTTAATTTSSAPPQPDAALIDATCTALTAERAGMREEALAAFYRANPDTSFVDWLSPVYTDCERAFANHAAAQSIRARTRDMRSIGYAGLSGCTESPATAEMRNDNGFGVQALAVALGEERGEPSGWGYTYLPNLPANTELPVDIPWLVPRPGPSCGLFVRAWVADDSAATATLHEMGDSPDSELPPGAPPLLTAGEDPEQILSSLLDFEFWLYRNPDPDLIEEITDVRDPGLAEFEAYLVDLVSSNSYWDLSAPLISVAILEELDEHTWLIEFETGPGSYSFYVDGELSRDRSYEWRRWLGVIRRSDYDGRWRWVADAIVLDEV